MFWSEVSIPFRGFRRAELKRESALETARFQSPSEVSDVLSYGNGAEGKYLLFQSPSEVSDVLSSSTIS